MAETDTRMKFGPVIDFIQSDTEARDVEEILILFNSWAIDGCLPYQFHDSKWDPFDVVIITCDKHQLYCSGMYVNEQTQIHPIYFGGAARWVKGSEFKCLYEEPLLEQVMGIHRLQRHRFIKMQDCLSDAIWITDITRLILHYLFSSAFFLPEN